MSEEHVSTGHEEHEESGSKQEKGHGATGGGWGFFFLGLAVSAALGWIFYPNVVMSSKEQPINFSHKAHTEGAGLTCDGCHSLREDGSFAGIPKLDKCAECHATPQGSNPEEAKLIAKYIQPGKEIPWLKYAFQPGCVFFSHAAHVNIAHMECKQCHGLPHPLRRCCRQRRQRSHPAKAARDQSIVPMPAKRTTG